MRWGILFRREVTLTYARIQDIHLPATSWSGGWGWPRSRCRRPAGAPKAEMTIEGLPRFEARPRLPLSRMRGAPRPAAAPPAPARTRRAAPPRRRRLLEVAAALREVARRGARAAGGAAAPGRARRQRPIERAARMAPPAAPRSPGAERPGDGGWSACSGRRPRTTATAWRSGRWGSSAALVGLVGGLSVHAAAGARSSGSRPGRARSRPWRRWPWRASSRSSRQLALLRLDFELRWYIVSDRACASARGSSRCREKTMTFANIQHIGIRQGPLQRLLGIADVEVRTAGGRRGEGERAGRWASRCTRPTSAAWTTRRRSATCSPSASAATATPASATPTTTPAPPGGRGGRAARCWPRRARAARGGARAPRIRHGKVGPPNTKPA